MDHFHSLPFMSPQVTPVIIKPETKDQEESGAQVEEKKDIYIKSDHCEEIRAII